jgi:hypothetical protein
MKARSFSKENIMDTPGERQEGRTEADEPMPSHLIPRRDFLTRSLVAGIGVIGLGFLDELPASAALEPEKPLAPANTLHVCGLAESGIIWHTIRFSNGGWQGSFGNVNAQESNSNLRFQDVDCSGIGGNLHVCGLGTGGIIWHTIRLSNGSWQSSFGNVNAQESNSNLRFQDVGCAGTASNKLHVCGLGTGGIIWHTIRLSNGSWQSSFGNVNAQESNSNLRFKKVDCTTVGENLHVCGLGTGGIIWHTIRLSNGSWQSSFGNVNAQQSNSGLRFTDISCAAIGGNLHVCGLGTDGRIWHTIRFSNGSWQGSFGDVNAQESNSDLRFVAVDCANVDNNLHVGGVARSHIIWHTIRFSNGSWQSSFGNVNAQESNGNLRFTDIGLGGVGG